MMRTYFPLRSPEGRFMCRVLLAVSLMLCLFCLPGLQEEYRLRDEIVTVDAVIERIEVTGQGEDIEYKVFVSYAFRGVEYKDIPLPHWSSDMAEGQTLSIRLHPDAPAEPRSDGLEFLLTMSLIGVGVSLILCVIAGRNEREGTRC